MKQEWQQAAGSRQMAEDDATFNVQRRTLQRLPRNPILRWRCLWLTVSLLLANPALANDTPRVLLVLGAPGEQEYRETFDSAAQSWEEAGRLAEARWTVLGRDNNTSETNAPTDLQQLQTLLAAEPEEGNTELWLILLGHGTYDGAEAKFNLRGPDLSAPVLAQWLEPFRRPLVLIVATSASGAFLPKLSAPGRVVLTATRSGDEQNYARLGEFLARAIADPEADLDKDGQTSLLEAFLTAARRVAAFYAGEGRLATEHALLDDNGDGRGTPADWYRALRPSQRPEGNAVADGVRAHQIHLVRSPEERKLPAETRRRRDELERNIAALRERKSALTEAEYYRRLDNLLTELARLYQGLPPTPKPGTTGADRRHSP